jgi:hypothetical protein
MLVVYWLSHTKPLAERPTLIAQQLVLGGVLLRTIIHQTTSELATQIVANLIYLYSDSTVAVALTASSDVPLSEFTLVFHAITLNEYTKSTETSLVELAFILVRRSTGLK